MRSNNRVQFNKHREAIFKRGNEFFTRMKKAFSQNPNGIFESISIAQIAEDGSSAFIQFMGHRVKMNLKHNFSQRRGDIIYLSYSPGLPEFQWTQIKEFETHIYVDGTVNVLNQYQESLTNDKYVNIYSGFETEEAEMFIDHFTEVATKHSYYNCSNLLMDSINS
jgi:hypothetical protein